MILVCYLRCIFSDPGFIKNLKHQKNWKWCETCKQTKPPRAYHCSNCRRCVFKMDHHCHYMNNCIGAKNLKFHLQFTGYMGLGSLYSLSFLTFVFASKWKGQKELSRLNLGLGVLGILFSLVGFLLSTSVSIDIWTRVITNMTYIEKLKKLVGKQLSFGETITRVFGTSSCFLPSTPDLKINYFEETFQTKLEGQSYSVLAKLHLIGALNVLLAFLFGVSFN